MKKTLLFILFSVSVVVYSFAQLPFSESFDTGIPATWQNIDNSANGGGVWEWINDSGEQFAVFNSDGYGNDGLAEDADLITPAIDCSSASFVALSFVSGFSQYANSVGTTSISTDGGTSWTDVFSVNATGGQDVLLDITALAAGESDVRIKFNYVGDWDYFWFIDDVLVYTPAANDMAGVSVNMGTYNDLADAPFDVTGTLVNLGSATVTSFDLNYTIDGGAAVTETVTGVNIGFGQTYNFTHSTGFTPSAAGNYNVTAYASNINGNADSNTANDETSKDIVVYDVAVQRVPLFEIFTSSTCGPCNPGNANYHSIVDPQPDQNFVSIKYQQDFPGTGDPYATDESVARRNFYGINSIPRMEIDGGWDGNANSFTQALYDDARAKPAFLFLHATYELDVANQSVSFEVEGLPVQDYAAGTYKLHVAIIENETSANVKSNGETSFEEVCKKFYPDNNGTTVASLDNLTTFDLSGSYAFNGTYRLPSDGQAANRIDHATEHSVEEFSDLRVVVWIEDETNREVLQAFNAVDPTDSDGDSVPDEVEAYSGTNPNDANDFPDLDNDGLSDWKEVQDGTNPLEDDGVNIVNVNDNNIDLTIAPVPADQFVNVAFEMNESTDMNISIIGIDGKVVLSKAIKDANSINERFDVSNLVNGVYFVEIETELGITSSKFVVSHK